MEETGLSLGPMFAPRRIHRCGRTFESTEKFLAMVCTLKRTVARSATDRAGLLKRRRLAQSIDGCLVWRPTIIKSSEDAEQPYQQFIHAVRIGGQLSIANRPIWSLANPNRCLKAERIPA
jgi:hypothetical protein